MNELRPLRPDAPRLRPAAKLPRSRFVPELHPHPRRSPEGSLHGLPEHAPGLPADRWPEDGSYLLGIDLYHQGYLWESHEALEACFFATDDPVHRRLVQALIQLAAAELQLHRGVGGGVRTLVRRVLAHLDAVAATLAPGDRFCGVDPVEIATAVRSRFVGALSEDRDALLTGDAPVLIAIAG